MKKAEDKQMTCGSIKVFQENGKYLVINGDVPAWIVTNAMGVYLVQLYASYKDEVKACEMFLSKFPQAKKVSLMRFLKEVMDAGLFSCTGKFNHHHPYPLGAVYLNVTRACNLKCSYCFASEREEHGTQDLSLEEFKGIIDQIARLGHPEIILTGGEPMVSSVTLPLARYIKKLHMTVKLLTNATLIDGKNVDAIAETFDSVKISLDGSSKERHDFYRGAGSYHRTLKAIELLEERNANILIAMVVTRQNVDDVAAMSRLWGNRLIFQPLFSMGRAVQGEKNLSLTGKEYYQALCQCANINPYMDVENVIASHERNHSILKCAIGDGEISISCTGDVYPCQLMHNKEAYIGNVREQPLQEIYESKRMRAFQKLTVDKMKGCKDCVFRYLCGGACHARHYSETYDLYQAGRFCEYEQLGIVHGILSNYELITI